MYTLAVKRDFIAQHFLVGEENRRHSHHYQVEVQLEGSTLNQHGYLADIVDINTHLEELVYCFRDKTLNEAPEFQGINPGLENFARILCQALSYRLQAPNLSAVRVKIWEDKNAWASYRRER